MSMADGVGSSSSSSNHHTHENDVEEPALFAYDWIIENFPHTYEEFCHQPRRGPYSSDRIEVRANNIASSISAVPGSAEAHHNDSNVNNLYGIWKMRLQCRGHPKPMPGPNSTVPMIPNKQTENNDADESAGEDEPNSSGSEPDAEERPNERKRKVGFVGFAAGKSDTRPRKKRKHNPLREPFPLVVTLRAMQLAEPVEAFVCVSLIDANESMVYSTRVRTKPYRFKKTVAEATEFELRVTKEELFAMPPPPSPTSPPPVIDSSTSPVSSATSSRGSRHSTGSGASTSTPNRGKRTNNFVQFASPATPLCSGGELPTFPTPLRSAADGIAKPMKYFYKHRTLRLRLELQIHPGTLWSPLHDDMLRLFTDAEEQPDEAAGIADFRVIVGKSTPEAASVTAATSSHGGAGGRALRSASSATHAHDSRSNSKTSVHGRADQHHHTTAASKHIPLNDHHTHSHALVSTSVNKQFVKSFRCHRLILANRCPFFAAMLANKKFREAARGEHHVNDVRPGVVRTLLQFIYTDFTAVIGLDFDAAYELYSLAREYELDRLLELCKFRMVQCVNAQNCLAAFRIGDLHDESVIKRVAIATVARQKHAVTQSASWADIMHNEPALLGKMLVEMAPMVGSLFSGPGSGVVNNYSTNSYTTNNISSGGIHTRASSSAIDPFSLQQLQNGISQHQTLMSSIAPVSSAAILPAAHNTNVPVTPLTTVKGVLTENLTNETSSATAGLSAAAAVQPSSARGGRRTNKKRKLN